MIAPFWQCVLDERAAKQRRRDFMRLMRRPDAEPLRMLLAYLRDNKCLDWHSITGLQLSRVTPAESVKWVASLEHNGADMTVWTSNFASLDWFHSYTASDLHPSLR